jgi:hypothetical protein
VARFDPDSTFTASPADRRVGREADVRARLYTS